MVITLQVSQVEILGKEVKEAHPSNKLSIVITLSIFHLEISGKHDNNLQLLNKKFLSVSVTLSIPFRYIR